MLGLVPALPWPSHLIPTQTASLFSSQVTCPCSHCLCICVFPFNLTTRSLLSHTGLLPPLPGFLLLRVASSCTLRIYLKICQLYFTPLFLRVVSQGILLAISLKVGIFPFINSRSLTLPCHSHIPQDCKPNQCMIKAFHPGCLSFDIII